MNHDLFRALPPYLGGKRRLIPLIFALLSEELPQERWCETTFLDLFCGGCSVSLFAKAQGLQVISGDIAERAVLVARALIANSTVRLTPSDALGLYSAVREPVCGIASKHSPSVFSPDQAAWLDRALENAVIEPEPKRSLLLLLIMKLALRCQPMSMLRGTDARRAASGDFDRVSPRRLGHYLKARDLFEPERVWRMAEEINAGVFAGHGMALKGDVLALLDEQAADVVYLDPPYESTTSYEHEYKVLDEMLSEHATPSKAPSLDDLLVATHRIPILILSYGGPTAGQAGLEATVSRHRRVMKSLAVPYTHLRSISKRPAHERFEYIIVART